MKQSIKEIKDRGEIIILSDSSAWKVDLFDKIDTSFWLKFDSVTVSGNKMTNHNQRDKTVGVKRIN